MTESDADFAPVELGLKVTVTILGAPPALIAKVVGLTVNIPAAAPVTVIRPTERGALPVLLTVNVCTPDDPTLTGPNDSAPEV